ncbi:deferrochelatase/peroxidase EfeB, partial [Streptomyces sp. NPDC059355]
MSEPDPESGQSGSGATTDVAGDGTSRRALLAWGGAGLALGAAAAGAAVAVVRRNSEPAVPGTLGTAVPFHGEYQAGIASAVQDRLHFAAFDVKTKDRAELVQLL